MRSAKSVRLLSVGEAPRKGTNALLPGVEMAATLSRRGIACEVDHVDQGNLSIGDAILGRIGDMGSDLLVMGIYGHSKLREFVFGGVTRHIMNHMTVPVLMSR
jgi:nucleotide-binding universal stress UspA family protein